MSQRYSNRGTYGGPVYREPYLERAEAYYAGSRAGPSRGGGMNNNNRGKHQSPASKQYRKQKEENFRQEKGTKVIEAYHSDLKKSLLCGFENLDEVIKAKAYEDTTRSIGIPVSTRAVGISVTTTINKIQATEANRQRLPQMTPFQMYRVMLDMVEKQIFENRIAAKLDDRDGWYDPQQFEEFKNVTSSINICPQQIGALLKCIPSFKFEDLSFVPLFPGKKIDDRQRFIPVPEVVYLTNLRETVVSLADQLVAIAVRRNFANKNPIPGAIFAQGALTNAEDIMPAGYNAASLMIDLYAVKNWKGTGSTVI